MLDFGGVLTTNLWESLRSFARREGLPENALVDLLTKDPEGINLLRSLERGAIGQLQFEREVASRLGVPADRLLVRMAADLKPDDDMLSTVAEIRATGVKVAVLSNSWGSDYFNPYGPWNLDERADVVILSHQVRLRKPDPEIFDLVVEKLGVPAGECLFIDDIPEYLEPARAKGMAVWHHTDSAATVAQLRRIFKTDSAN